MTDLQFIDKVIEEKKAMILDISDRIYAYAELPYAEHKSAKLLCDVLGQEGFTVTEGVAEIPTAFTASYGTGKLVIGFLGEYDALDILSQEAGNPQKKTGQGRCARSWMRPQLFGRGRTGRGHSR